VECFLFTVHTLFIDLISAAPIWFLSV